MKRHMMRVNDKIKRLLAHTSHSFSPFLALATLQLVLGLWSVYAGADVTPMTSLAGVTKDHIAVLPGFMPSVTDATVSMTWIGLIALVFGIAVWALLMHIGYDLEERKVKFDETCMIGGLCGLILGATSAAMPVALLLSRFGLGGLLLVAPITIAGLFVGVVFGTTLVTLGALIRKYVVA